VTAKKASYLVCYDYGQGGLWAFVKGHSAQEISVRYPELMVFPEAPPFYNQSQLNIIADALTVDVDDEPTGWLKEMVEQRKKTP